MAQTKFPAVQARPVFALFRITEDAKQLVGIFAEHEDAVAYATLRKVESWHIDGVNLYPCYGSDAVIGAARLIFAAGITTDAREAIEMVRAERYKRGLPCE